MGRMRAAVAERFGVRLEPEIVLLGDLRRQLPGPPGPERPRGPSQ